MLVIHPEKNEAEAFFSTVLSATPETIIKQYVLRRNIEVTFFETRVHLGIGRNGNGQTRQLLEEHPV